MNKRTAGHLSGRGRKFLILLVLLAMFISSATVGIAKTDDYVAQEAGHPIRIAAYLLFPATVAVDYLVMRPSYWMGKREPFRTLFGFEEINPFIIEEDEDKQE